MALTQEQKALLDSVKSFVDQEIARVRGEITRAAEAARPFLDAEDARRKFLLQRRTRTVNNLKSLLQGV